jgi:hypothetical protein
MSHRLPLNYGTLDKFLLEIREFIKNSDIQANPFFHLVKPTEENISKYRFYKPESLLFLTFDTIFFFPRIVIEVLYALAISIFWSTYKSQSQLASSTPCESLFLSHYTSAQFRSDKDVCFGSAVDSPNSYVFYLNHTRKSTKQILAGFKQKNRTRVFVNAKTLSLLPMLKIQLQQSKVSWSLFKHALCREGLPVSQRRLLFRGARFQHSRPTLANLILRNRMMTLMSSLQPKRLIFTLEGHAHEVMLINSREEFFSRTQIVAYQHAPVVPLQFNIKRVASMLRSSDLILTSGPTTKSFFLQASPIARIEILGSPKARVFEYQLKDESHLRVLLTPEAARESLLEFAQLARKLSINVPGALFTIRLHPDTSKKLLRIVKETLKKSSNIQISELALAADLKSSHVTVFRSSAAAIEGLAFGSLPVHFELGGSGNLNPLYGTQYDVPAFYEYEGLIKYLSALNISKCNSQEKQRESFKIFTLYFAKLQNFSDLIL